MSFDAIVTLISSVGFPIAVALYLLTTFNKSIKEQTEATIKLTEVIQKLCEQKS